MKRVIFMAIMLVLVVCIVHYFISFQYHDVARDRTQLPSFDRPIEGLRSSITQPLWIGNKISITYCLSWISYGEWLFLRPTIPLNVLCFDKAGHRLSPGCVVSVIFPEDFLSGQALSVMQPLTFIIPDNTVDLAIQFDHSNLVTDIVHLPLRRAVLVRNQQEKSFPWVVSR